MDLRALIRGDSFLMRAAIFLLMSGIFVLIVSVTKRHATVMQLEKDTTQTTPTTSAKPAHPVQTPSTTKQSGGK
jgi:hypothetical protein